MRKLSGQQQSDLLSEVTVVIVTRERESMARASLNFWSHVGVKVLMIDGSARRIEKLAIPERARYVHAHVSYLARLKIASEMLTTRWVILACDDEIYSPSSLAACAQFLSSHPDYSAVGGEAVGFRARGDELEFLEQYPRLKGFRLDSISPSERFLFHLGDYKLSYLFFLTRSETWSKVWAKLAKIEFEAFGSHELQYEAAMAYSGKVHVLPEIMWFRNRQVSPQRVPGMAGWDPRIKFCDWWKDENTSRDRNDFVALMVEVFESFEKETELLSEEGLSLLVRRGFNNYCDSLQSRRPNFLRRVVGKIISELQGRKYAGSGVDSALFNELAARVSIVTEAVRNAPGDLGGATS